MGGRGMFLLPPPRLSTRILRLRFDTHSGHGLGGLRTLSSNDFQFLGRLEQMLVVVAVESLHSVVSEGNIGIDIQRLAHLTHAPAESGVLAVTQVFMDHAFEEGGIDTLRLRRIGAGVKVDHSRVLISEALQNVTLEAQEAS